MPTAVLVALYLAATPAPAPVGPRPETCTGTPLPAPVVVDEDACRFEGRAIRISLVSPTGCWAEDDMALGLEQGGKKVEARWPGEFPTSWWMLDPASAEDGTTWPPAGPCRRVDAVTVGEGRLLLFLRRSGRPNADRLVALLYDARRHAVLDLKDVGAQGDLVARAEGAVWFREREYGEGVVDELVRDGSDELPLPDGDRIVSASGNDRPVNPVWRVGARKDRILAERDVERTAALFRSVFPTAEAFRAAFAWGGPDERTMAREGRSASGRACLQPHRGESLEAWRQLRWYCAPPR